MHGKVLEKHAIIIEILSLFNALIFFPTTRAVFALL